MSGNQSAAGYNTNGNGSGTSTSNNTTKNGSSKQYSAMDRWMAEGKKDEPWNPLKTGSSGSRRADGKRTGGGSSSRR